MRGLRAIPRRLLCDDMVVVRDGRTVASVSHVRLDEGVSLVCDEYGQHERRAGTVYVDAVHSRGARDFLVDDVLLVRGRKYLVAGVTACEGVGGRVHHWELTVSGVREDGERTWGL